MNSPIMFIIGCVIFFVYLYALLKAIHWGHNSQREDMLNDPEMRNYYSRHGMPDNMDYDGMVITEGSHLQSQKREKERQLKLKQKPKKRYNKYEIDSSR